MAYIRASQGGGGGGINGNYAFSFTEEETLSATDNNPIVFYGDFSAIKSLMGWGLYAQNQGYRGEGGQWINITLGTKYKVALGKASANTSYRNVTVYANRVEIGSGYYQNTESSIYGRIRTLSLFDSEITI